MSGSSDSEEFYDAEDNTPFKTLRRLKTSHSSSKAVHEVISTTCVENKSENVPATETVESHKMKSTVLTSTVSLSSSYSENQVIEKNQHGRRRFMEIRQRIQTDDEEGGGGGSGVAGGGGGVSNSSPPNSHSSSMDGIISGPDTGKSSHPFRIIEHDAVSLQSMTSLGRVGRILSGVQDTGGGGMSLQQRDSTVSSSLSGSTSTLKSQSEFREEDDVLEERERDCEEERRPVPPPEPDVIASTKSSSNSGAVAAPPPADPPAVVPVAPPRKKKKSKPQPAPVPILPLDTQHNIAKPSANEMPARTMTCRSCSLPSPASTIESLTREFEHSLDIHSATKGQYVVKPQDEDQSKAEGPSQSEIERVEQLKRQILQHRESLNMGSAVDRGHHHHLDTSHVLSASSNGIVGKSSLKPFGFSPRNSRERRRSAGDEHGLIAQQLNMFVRTRTDSGKQLSDMEILEQVTVLNLDTGERVPLSIAEDKLPQCINPLSLHIMRLTSEYVSNPSLEKEKESDEESVISKKSTIVCEEPGPVKRKTAKLKQFMKRTVSKAKTIAQEVSTHARHRDDALEVVDEVCPSGEQYIKLKASNSHKGPYEFDCLQHVQDLSNEHVGPVWCMKFSQCGRLLATAGQDRVLRIWVVRNAYAYFQDTRTKYNAEKVSPTPSQESLVSQQSSSADDNAAQAEMNPDDRSPFMPKPFCTYTGHTSDLLDVSWSKNYFVLSSSMDKTVRLWHISRKECLCCFQHIDFVTAIVFHPRDDRYFLSGSLDGKLRLWNIPDKKVAVWNEVDGNPKLITAANFCQNGKFAVVGSYDGRCIFYNTDQLKYHTQIHVRSTRGKNSTGRKISGIEPMPEEDKILVTSNDSRIRLYDLRDLNLSCKYKGYVNVSSQIKASFSHDGKYIVSGSENQCIYIWKTHHDYSKFSSVRRDRNDYWEGVKVHNAVVTCAVFAPNPDVIIQQMEEPEPEPSAQGYVLVSADFNGGIKVFLNKTKPKHSSLPASALI
ncbi:WD repeat-containing protein 44-like [Nilaparvata lugens]|uniref:WD repeat-containing protein 44-like n=1 Tax=Nilaparvata lugens TaxID=108931 RepID=UPI00193CED8D|nr:WD repeat-containing protein 44-like [Nilaparvata lugens]